MKALLSLVLAAATIVVPARAQDCTPSSLARKPGTLRASKLSGSTTGVTAADLARERVLLANVHKMVAAGYNPVGVVGDYSSHFDSGNGAPGAGKIADAFGYSMYLLKYNCDKNSADKSQFSIGTDSPTVLRIDANAINQLGMSATNIADNTFRGYFMMKDRPEKKDGYYFLGDEFSGDSRTRQREYTWLITYDDALPFSHLSRKEYLLLAKARLQKAIQENGGDASFHKEFVDRVNQFLGRSDAELSQPAIVNRGEEERFTGFAEEGSRGAVFPVKHNAGYYRKGLPRSAPQFYTVVFSVFEGDDVPVYVDNMNILKRAVDFNILRGMLGK